MSQGPGGTTGSRKGPLRAQLPLLDRLLGAGPGTLDRPTPTAAEALEQLHAAVRRDLEALLNARRRRRPLPGLLSELPSSLINYGIPDPASGAYAVPELRAELVAEVEATIRRFEPRLSKVSVALADDASTTSRTLRLKIDAVLAAESVSFETLLEPVTRDVSVRET